MNNQSNTALAGEQILYGSSTQPSLIKRPDHVDEATGETIEGETVQLGTVVRHAFELSGIATVDEWNGLTDDAREAFIVAGLRDLQLPVRHRAQLEVLGAENLTVERQADIVRLNPGVEGLSPEAYKLAAEQDAANLPLPEAETIPLRASVEGLQAPSPADANAIGETLADNASPAAASNGEAESAAQNHVAAKAELPGKIEKPSATVRNAPEGGGFLVKFSDKDEEHFYSEKEEMQTAVSGYAWTQV